MSFNNRTAEREAYPHAVVLGCIERIEEPIDSIGNEADTGVPHNEPHAFVIVALRFDQQLSRPVVDVRALRPKRYVSDSR